VVWCVAVLRDQKQSSCFHFHAAPQDSIYIAHPGPGVVSLFQFHIRKRSTVDRGKLSAEILGRCLPRLHFAIVESDDHACVAGLPLNLRRQRSDGTALQRQRPAHTVIQHAASCLSKESFQRPDQDSTSTLDIHPPRSYRNFSFWEEVKMHTRIRTSNSIAAFSEQATRSTLL
jgi:hypothetical protein